MVYAQKGRTVMPSETTAYLTVLEAAERLRTSPQTVYRWCRAGKLGALKIGKEWRIPAGQPGLRSQPADLAPLDRLLAGLSGESGHLAVFADRGGLARFESTFFEVAAKSDGRLVYGRWEETEAEVRRRLRPVISRARDGASALHVLNFLKAYEAQGAEGVARLLSREVELAAADGKTCCAYTSCYAYFGYHVDRLTAYQGELHERVRDQPALLLCGYVLEDFLAGHPGRGMAVCMELIHCHTGVIWFDGERALLRRPTGWPQ